MVMTKESIIKLHKEMNNIGRSLDYYYIGKNLKIIGKMPDYIFEKYFCPYTYKETQRRLYETIIIFDRYLRLMNMIDKLFGFGK